MALYTVNPGDPIASADVDQCVSELDRQSGQQEIGKYWLAGDITSSGQLVSEYLPSRSRYASPVSVTIDAADGNTNCSGTPSKNHISSSGFQVYGFSAASTPDMNVGGNTTIQY